MANTFFGFDTSLNNDQHLLPDDDGELVETEEDEYDALNDETFGLSDSSTLNDDWEEQHAKFAHDDENSKQSERIENSIRELVLDDSDDPAILFRKSSPWKQPNHPPPPLRHPLINGDVPHMPTVEEIEKMCKPVHNMSPQVNTTRSLLGPTLHYQDAQPNLMKRMQQPPPPRLPPGFHAPHPIHNPFPCPPLPPRSVHPQRLPPGFPPCIPRPMNLPGPYHLLRPMPPHPAFPGAGFPPNFAPPMHPHLHQHLMRQQHLHQMQQQHQQQLHRQQLESVAVKHDEYSGLMTSREKQWLLNIQHIQLNTGTPYFDDYYYTVFKERKSREKDKIGGERLLHHHHQHPHHRTDSNSLTGRVYTPLQFENSLGKLQCGSVTAPRKIIDTDIVTMDKDTDAGPARDTRKTKQLLLELESLFGLLLKAEDLMNPTAIANGERLREMKQKQRLREMDAATTNEQKQELLRLLQVESEPMAEHHVDYLMRIMAGLLHEDKFAAFLNIRKGKMLLLRVLPLLGVDYTIEELVTLWGRVLLCIPLIGRRDMAGDNLLPRLHPYFKRFVQMSRMSDVLRIVGKLEQTRIVDSRCTPIGYQAKPPLLFIVGNKFGVSALVTILVRTEYLISSGNASAPQVDDWLAFVQNWADMSNGRSNVATPIELIPRPIFTKHMNRFGRISDERKRVLDKHFVDVN